MFKNILITILLISTVVFAGIAIKNSKPIECDEILRAGKDELVCIIELGDIQKDEVYEALQQRYEKQPLFNA